MATKVLHVINSLCTGGAQVCLRDIVNGKTEGFEHYIYTLRPDVGKFKFDVKVFESGFCNYDVRKFFYFVKLCKRLKIDIVHAHLHKASIFAVLLKKFYKCKVIVHEHGAIEQKGIDFSAYRLFMKYFGRGADKIIAVSEYIKGVFTAVTGMGDDKFVIIRNAVDRSVFVPSEEVRTRWRQKYGVGNSFVIGYIGRLRYVKGIDNLIKAFDLIKRDGADLKLLIAGDGGDREDFENMAKKSDYSCDIMFTGFCEKPYEMMQAFDIGAVPSRQEAFGIVVVELMAAGAVIITSGAEGISEVVKDRYNGLIFDNSPQAIADCIQMLLSCPQLADELRTNAFKTAAKYDISQYREKINGLYEYLR
jgi:glycosyltransferase involved in cell wall biosynthesis